MPGVTCGRVRAVLSDVVAGRPVSADDSAWSTLSGHGALLGSPSSPEITPVGRHVLAELEVRAGRIDGLTLDAVAEQLSRIGADLDQVARTAEYFLADLGPVTPPDALPLLRPVALGLANRRETPEELAEGFRNVWGGVEVMGGDARDRLLAAELLNASDAKMETLYAPLMTTTTKIREKLGPSSPAVAAAALLHLHPDRNGDPALAAFATLRGGGLSAEEAGLLASLTDSPAETLARREKAATALSSAAGGSPAHGRVAASFLVALGSDAPPQTERVRELASLLKGRLPDPLVGATLLSSIDWLEPREIANWVEKAIDVVRLRRLAPTDPELTALAIGIVHGLPRSAFNGDPSRASTHPRATSAGVLAIHAWVYRPLISRAAPDATRASGTSTG